MMQMKAFAMQTGGGIAITLSFIDLAKIVRISFLNVFGQHMVSIWNQARAFLSRSLVLSIYDAAVIIVIRCIIINDIQGMSIHII